MQGDRPSSSSTLEAPSRPAPLADQVGPVTEVVAPPPPDAPPATQRFSLGNRPSLTGLRALLIACILIYHSNFKTMPGSWAALGTFFVLSGFLITTMLASERQKTGRVDLKKFYSRRTVRLLPPLLITVVLLAGYASIVRVSDAADHLWGDVAGAVFYYADYRSALGHESAFGYLAQCWSLAIEEQFYLIWAVLLFVALRYGTRRIAYAIAIAGIVISVADRLWIVLRAPVWTTQVSSRVYYAFDTRADALFLGCLLGLIATGGHLDGWRPASKRILAWLAVVSAAVTVWLLFDVAVTARSLPLYWLPVSEVSAAVIITYFLIYPTSLGTRALGIPILVLLGNMSYAIYLFHWPVYAAISPFTVRWPFWAYQTVRLVVIGALALASWYFVEQPLMAWRRRAFEPTPAADAEATPNLIPTEGTSVTAATTATPTPDAAVPRPSRMAPARPRPMHSAVMATDLLEPTVSGAVGPVAVEADPQRRDPNRPLPRWAVDPVTASGLLAGPVPDDRVVDPEPIGPDC